MLLYYFDNSTKRFLYTDILEDDAEMPENATTIAPVNSDGSGMYAPTFNGTTWVSMPEEQYQKEFEQEQAPVTSELTDDQKREAQYMLEMTKMKASIAANAKMLAALTKQLTQTKLTNSEVQ